MRVLRTVLSAVFFLMFGVGGLLFSLLLVFPVSKMRARRILRASFVFFVRAGESVRLFSVDVSADDRRRLKSISGSVVVSNHQTLIDAVILLSLLGDSVCITKESVSRNLFMRTVARKILVVNGETVTVIRSAAGYLNDGVNVVVFPEGTRTPADAPEHVFRRGAAHIAMQAKAPVELVYMDCDMRILAKGQPWWDVGGRAAVYRVKCKGRVEPGDFQNCGVSAKETAEKFTEMMRKGVFGE